MTSQGPYHVSLVSVTPLIFARRSGGSVLPPCQLSRTITASLVPGLRRLRSIAKGKSLACWSALWGGSSTHLSFLFSHDSKRGCCPPMKRDSGRGCRQITTVGCRSGRFASEPSRTTTRKHTCRAQRGYGEWRRRRYRCEVARGCPQARWVVKDDVGATFGWSASRRAKAEWRQCGPDIS